MPRKENNLSMEERMQRAKELSEKKALLKEKNLKELYASTLYKIARKSCIAFLWIGQLLLIDWALPYLEEKDKISGGYFNANTITTQGIGGITDYRLPELFIKTEKGYKFHVDFPDNTQEPSIGDSIILMKSLIFHDFKKIVAPRIKESYFVSSSVTFKYLPFLFIVSGLAVLFIFVKNIEVKAFAWISLLTTASVGIFFIICMVMSFQ